MTTAAIVVIIVVAIVVAAAVWFVFRKQRTEKLRKQFGPEYERSVRVSGSQTKAEQELLMRQKRMEKISIRPLAAVDREHFTKEWHNTQARFVDDPPASIREADQLVCNLMKVRGYPVSDFEHRAADLSVDHPHVVKNYRAAHTIAERSEHGEASTEDLRQAMVYYRDLFDELLEAQPVGASGERK